MAKRKIPQIEIPTQAPTINKNQEKISYETLLSQRIHFIILFFVIVIGGTLVTLNYSKNYLILVLSLGAIISWALTFSVLQLSLKLRAIEKTSGNIITKPIKLILKIPRIILGWLGDLFIPIFCSLVITVSLGMAFTGYFDIPLIPNKMDEKIKDVLPTDKKIKLDTTKKKSEYIKEFQNLDSLLKK
ncbi:MAG: hypothetical protein FJ214_01295 [Ignavibacteria bacterium]|nr:hypothetical protein [Ignavibacteria bacterium]